MSKKEFGERLRLVRERLWLSQEEMASLLGLSKPGYANNERGDKAPSVEFVNDYCNKLNISPAWLITGRGPQFLDALPFINDRGIEDVDLGESWLPIFGERIQGDPKLMEDPSCPQLTFQNKLNKDNYFCFIISGDSMQPRYRPSDLLVCARSESAHSEDEVVVALPYQPEGIWTCLCRRWLDLGDQVRLESLNPYYTPIVLPRDKVDLIGVVVGMVKPELAKHLYLPLMDDTGCTMEKSEYLNQVYEIAQEKVAPKWEAIAAAIGHPDIKKRQESRNYLLRWQNQKRG